ncbi:MAG: hypothetical protein HYZ42_17100, partial [Bacteroidetes bacterium]|nr:hypothetical protein [Bacteroidota bacterium]
MRKIIEVCDAHSLKVFLDFYEELYAHDNNIVMPFKQELAHLIDPSKNDFLKQGECKKWILLEEDRCVGRIATFVFSDRKDRVARIGFFEAKDKEAAFQMFD